MVQRSSVVTSRGILCRSRGSSGSSLLVFRVKPLAVPQVRSFFVRGTEVPEHLKDHVFKQWNRFYGTLFAVNAAVWLGWQSDFLENILPGEYSPLIRRVETFLDDNFTVSKSSLSEGSYDREQKSGC